MTGIKTVFLDQVFYVQGSLTAFSAYSELYCPYSRSSTDFSICARSKAMQEILALAPTDFPRFLCAVMKLQKVSTVELCRRIPVSEHTVSYLRRVPRYSYSIDQVVAIVVGLHLPPQLGRKLLALASITLDHNPAAAVYGLVIDTLFMMPFDDVQRLLIGSGLPPIRLKGSAYAPENDNSY